MPIRARVGRHTRSGGGHCQNWADDQKVIIDLLNSIPRTSGGTQGSLNPRIVAGICSNELYAAISAFEDKYWPGQRSGYIDPGGAMYQKLALLAAPRHPLQRRRRRRPHPQLRRRPQARFPVL